MSQRIRILFLMASLMALLPLAAQEALPPAIESSGGYTRGDMTLTLSTGFQIPLFILPREPDMTGAKLLLGGSFGFTYQYFLGKNLAVGASWYGAFNGTIAGRTLFVSPIALRSAWWWSRESIEVGLAAEVGGFLERMESYNMLGPFAKFGPEVSWKLTQGWSIGAQIHGWFVPELHSGTETAKTRYAAFLAVSAAAIYKL